jgi:hypothetical protein
MRPRNQWGALSVEASVTCVGLLACIFVDTQRTHHVYAKTYVYAQENSNVWRNTRIECVWKA